MLLRLINHFRKPVTVESPPAMVIPGDLAHAKTVAVTEPVEEYFLPPEAVGEYCRLSDMYNRAPPGAREYEQWQRWSYIARNVPAVAKEPLALWRAETVRILTVRITRITRIGPATTADK